MPDAVINPDPNLGKKYKTRGFQQLSLKDYEALKKKRSRRYRPKLPPHLKIILGTPFLLVFCFGLFFIPIIIYQIATGRPSEKEKSAHKASKSTSQSRDYTSRSTADR